MTISTTIGRTSYTGSGSTGPFAYPFKIFAATDLLVTKRSFTGVETTLVNGTNYSVAGVGEATGTITLVTALAVGETLFIRRAPPLVQPMSIRNQGAYFPATIEDEIDRLLTQIQSLQDQLDRSPKFSESINPVAPFTLEPTTGYAITGTGTGWSTSPISAGAVALPGAGRTTTTLSAYLLNNSVYNWKDFGAVGDAITNVGTGLTTGTDNTAKIQASINAAHAAGGGTSYGPKGKYLLGTLTWVVADGGQPLNNSANGSQVLLTYYDDITVCGEGWSTILYAADGLVNQSGLYGAYSNYAYTKGFIFFHDGYNPASRFTLRDMKLDFNGFNNLPHAINGYGFQEMMPGVYNFQGGGYATTDLRVENVWFHNDAGRNCIVIDPGTAGVYLLFNEFTALSDATVNHLGAPVTNTNITDHSTINCSGTKKHIIGNKFIQPRLSWISTALEVHGADGIIAGNYCKWMSTPFLQACGDQGDPVTSEYLLWVGNEAVGARTGFYMTMSNPNFNVKARFYNNHISIRGTPVPIAGPAAITSRRGTDAYFLSRGNLNFGTGIMELDAKGNTFIQETPIAWSATDILDNNCLRVAQFDRVNLLGDTFEGFQGAVVRLDQQIDRTRTAIIIDACKYFSCGNANTWAANNGLVSFANGGSTAVKVDLRLLRIKGSEFYDCKYSAITSLDILVGGAAPAIKRFEFVDNWLDTYLVPHYTGAGSNYPDLADNIFYYDYKMRAAINTARLITTAPNTVGRFEVLPDVGIVTQANYLTKWIFEKALGSDYVAWRRTGFFATTNGPGPVVVGPYDDHPGDRYICDTAAEGQAREWWCTVTGGVGVLGTWRAAVVVQAEPRFPGDTSINVVVTTMEQSVIWNVPITAARTGTLDTASAVPGAKALAVRTAAATGAFTVTVAGKVVPIGNWIEFQYSKVLGAWIQIRAGVLL